MVIKTYKDELMLVDHNLPVKARELPSELDSLRINKKGTKE